MSSPVPRQDLIQAAKSFGLPQIEIVNPKIVICIGLATFNALRKAIYPKCRNLDLDGAIKLSPRLEFEHSKIFCQAHTGYWGQRNRKKEIVKDDWSKMVDEYKEL